MARVRYDIQSEKALSAHWQSHSRYVGQTPRRLPTHRAGRNAETTVIKPIVTEAAEKASGPSFCVMTAVGVRSQTSNADNQLMTTIHLRCESIRTRCMNGVMITVSWTTHCLGMCARSTDSLTNRGSVGRAYYFMRIRNTADDRRASLVTGETRSRDDQISYCSRLCRNIEAGNDIRTTRTILRNDSN